MMVSILFSWTRTVELLISSMVTWLKGLLARDLGQLRPISSEDESTNQVITEARIIDL